MPLNLPLEHDLCDCLPVLVPEYLTAGLRLQVEMQQPKPQQQHKSPEDLQNIVTAVK